MTVLTNNKRLSASLRGSRQQRLLLTVFFIITACSPRPKCLPLKLGHSVHFIGNRIPGYSSVVLNEIISYSARVMFLSVFVFIILFHYLDTIWFDINWSYYSFLWLHILHHQFQSHKYFYYTVSIEIKIR